MNRNKEWESKSISWFIKKAFEKIVLAVETDERCVLSINECRAIYCHHAIGDAIGNYTKWEFDEKYKLIERDLQGNIVEWG